MSRVGVAPRLVAAAGGALAIAQAALLWEHVALGTGATVPRSPGLDWIGADANPGRIILAVGVVVLIVAVVGSWSGRRAPGLVLACGGVAFLIAVANYARVQQDVNDWNAAFASVRNVPGFGGIGYEVGPGAYLGVAGTGLATLAGALGLAAAGAGAAAGEGVATAGSGRFRGPLTGWVVRHALDEPRQERPTGAKRPR